MLCYSITQYTIYSISRQAAKIALNLEKKSTYTQ